MKTPDAQSFTMTEGSLVLLLHGVPNDAITPEDLTANLAAVFTPDAIGELTHAYRELLILDIGAIMLETPEGSAETLESAFYDAARELRRRIGGIANLTPYLDSLGAVGRPVSDTRKRVHYRILEAMSLRVQEMMQRSGFTPSYAQAECAVSDSLLALARTVRCGDTVELPDGTTLTCTFKP